MGLRVGRMIELGFDGLNSGWRGDRFCGPIFPDQEWSRLALQVKSPL